MEMNSKIDWLFITDQDLASKCHNISMLKMSFSDFADIVQHKFDFPISLKKPYKICDFRPAFAEIFPQEVEGYDFWGHCDLDLIFGDIFAVLPKFVWESQKILARGSLSFYRNLQVVNQLYKKQILYTMDHRSVFADDKSSYFDEWHGINRKFELNGMEVWNDDSFIFDINKNRYHLRTTDNLRRNIRISHMGKIFMYDKTKKYEVEGAYVHLQKRMIFETEIYSNQEDFNILHNTIVRSSRSKQSISYILRMRIVFFLNRYQALKNRVRKKFFKF
jgi:hypothetical protein